MGPVRYCIALACFLFVVGTWLDYSPAPEIPDVYTAHMAVDDDDQSDATIHFDVDNSYAVVIIPRHFGGEVISPDVDLRDLTSSEQVYNKGPTINKLTNSA